MLPSPVAPCTFRTPKTFRELRFILQIDLRCALEITAALPADGACGVPGD
jgi:hypothetical protein